MNTLLHSTPLILSLDDSTFQDELSSVTTLVSRSKDDTSRLQELLRKVQAVLEMSHLTLTRPDDVELILSAGLEIQNWERLTGILVASLECLFASTSVDKDRTPSRFHNTIPHYHLVTDLFQASCHEWRVPFRGTDGDLSERTRKVRRHGQLLSRQVKNMLESLRCDYPYLRIKVVDEHGI